MNTVASFLLILITVANLAIVAASSLLTVHGDGTSGGIYWVIGAGVVWIFFVAIFAIRLANQGQNALALIVAGLTLPVAGIILQIGFTLFIGIQKILGYMH